MDRNFLTILKFWGLFFFLRRNTARIELSEISRPMNLTYFMLCSQAKLSPFHPLGGVGVGVGSFRSGYCERLPLLGRREAFGSSPACFS